MPVRQLECHDRATSGNYTISGTSGIDIIAGLGGDDSITAVGKGDIVCGGDGQRCVDRWSGHGQVRRGTGTDAASSARDQDDSVIRPEGNGQSTMPSIGHPV